jgi:hypothetical protein
MLISHTYRLIYLKTVKTAGTSVEVLLQEKMFPGIPATHEFPGFIGDNGIIGSRLITSTFPYYNHISADRLKLLVGDELFTRYLCVACVRNPYDKMVSWFWFNTPPHVARLLRWMPFTVSKILFSSWLHWAFPDPDTGIFISHDEVQVDVFLRYESLAPDVSSLMERLGLNSGELELPRLKSEHRLKPHNWKKYYSSKTAGLVSSKYPWEFENLYQKDSWR